MHTFPVLTSSFVLLVSIAVALERRYLLNMRNNWRCMFGGNRSHTFASHYIGIYKVMRC